MSSPSKKHCPSLKLYYFNIRGKAEPIRLFCAHAGLDIVDHRFSDRAEFAALKENGRLAFGQVPMLEVDGRHQLVQSASILRYLARIAGMHPDDPLEAARVDAALDQEADAFTGATVATYQTRFGIDLDDAGLKRAVDLIGVGGDAAPPLQRGEAAGVERDGMDRGDGRAVGRRLRLGGPVGELGAAGREVPARAGEEVGGLSSVQGIR
eukprot:CAMPEP_0183295348 /NCGR_PEP_ID=MMETSP0160_2-20130417/3338_1 /TAXON_ID=2839 ORGANISM="Odontella Sinensis, Strain Grunow 1884" /NCGR_SAMPLE_ID=MMETSP0160_2 /ASSEMBLY_ACC=CAM_ASM_000250 /LENGTH=208 /DNA_ID=CAMNT_0025456817 /DNA_START=63 /DNA_END=688 /DNA_ORIENTATION=+